MRGTRAYVAIGANGQEPACQIAEALDALEGQGLSISACARIYCGPYLDSSGAARDDVADVWNTVVACQADGTAAATLQVLLEIERSLGRVRDGGAIRAIDLDLLAFGDQVVAEPGVTVPHPRCLDRAFVLEPWSEIAPTYIVPGTDLCVMAHADLHAARQGAAAHATLRVAAPAPSIETSGATAPRRLENHTQLLTWRDGVPGTVGLVPTMGALHAGHLSLVRQARTFCDHVLVTLFVNPLQFAADEDLDRYPRTLEQDCKALRRMGADAVYVPAPDDLYPAGFATYVEPGGAALDYEGASRPGHFRGVATVVAKLWQRTRPDVSFFGRKDAQQVAMLAQIHRDLDFPGQVQVCETIRDVDGVALSSRNRFLDDTGRARAACLSRALTQMGHAVGASVRDVPELVKRARATLQGDNTAGEAGPVEFEIEYVDVVDPRTFRPVRRLTELALAIAVVRVGGVRLLDNRWLAPIPEAS